MTARPPRAGEPRGDPLPVLRRRPRPWSPRAGLVVTRAALVALVAVVALTWVLAGGGAAAAAGPAGDGVLAAPGGPGTPGTASPPAPGGPGVGRAEPPPATPPGAAAGPSVVLVGVPGLSWADVAASEPGSALLAAVGQGAAASLSVRTVRLVACPQDAWLTVSAGRRATATRDGGPVVPRPGSRAARGCEDRPLVPPPEPVAGADPPRWEVPGQAGRVAANRRVGFGPRPGLLGAAVHDAGLCTAGVGSLGALGVAGTTGRLDRVADLAALADGGPGLAAVAGCPLLAVGTEPGDAPAADAEAALRAVAPVVADDAAVLLLGTGDEGTEPGLRVALEVSGADLRAGLSLPPVVAGAVPQAAVPQGAVPQGAVPQGAGPGGRGSGGAAAADVATAAARLETASTRSPGLVQLTDVAPTVLDRLGLPRPPDLVGAPWRVAPVPVPVPLADLVDAQVRAAAYRATSAPFFAVLLVGQVLLYVAAAVALRGGPVGSPRAHVRVLRALRLVGLTGAAVPGASFLVQLVPWWRSPAPLPVALGLGLLAAVAVAVVSLAGPWRRSPLGPVAVVGAVTAGLLAVDVATGSRLQTDAPAGYTPLVAGRFYGFGNVAFAIFASGLLLALAGLAAGTRAAGAPARAAGALVAVVGAAAVLLVGAPDLGADVGGVLALAPAVGVLALSCAGVRVGWRSVVLVGLVGVALVCVLAGLDALRPPASRTHLGAFVADVLAGQGGEVVARKLAANVSVLLGSAFFLLVPLALVLVAAVLARPARRAPRGLLAAFDAAPELHAALVAAALVAGVGMVVNDSGVAVPALVLAVCVPAAVAAAAAAREALDRAGPRPSRGAAARRPEPAAASDRVASDRVASDRAASEAVTLETTSSEDLSAEAMSSEAVSTEDLPAGPAPGPPAPAPRPAADAPGA